MQKITAHVTIQQAIINKSIIKVQIAILTRSL